MTGKEVRQGEARGQDRMHDQCWPMVPELHRVTNNSMRNVSIAQLVKEGSCKKLMKSVTERDVGAPLWSAGPCRTSIHPMEIMATNSTCCCDHTTFISSQEHIFPVRRTKGERVLSLNRKGPPGVTSVSCCIQPVGSVFSISFEQWLRWVFCNAQANICWWVSAFYQLHLCKMMNLQKLKKVLCSQNISAVIPLCII